MPQLPDKVFGSGQQASWLNRLRDYIRANTVVDSADILVDRGTHGTNLKLSRAAAGGALTWRGEWQSGTSYLKGDLVIRGSENLDSAGWNDYEANITGSNAGLYVAIRTVSETGPAPTEPNTDADKYWETLARFSTRLFSVTEAGAGSSRILLDARTPDGEVNIALSQANGKTLDIREVEVCVAGVTKKMMVLGSEPY